MSKFQQNVLNTVEDKIGKLGVVLPKKQLEDYYYISVSSIIISGRAFTTDEVINSIVKLIINAHT